MDCITFAGIAIFGVTLFLMVKRPQDLRLGYAAGIGATAPLLLGTVTGILSYLCQHIHVVQGLEAAGGQHCRLFRLLLLW